MKANSTSMSKSIDEIVERMAYCIGESKDERRDDTSLIFDEMKQALYDLMLSEVIGEDLQVLPTGYMPESHEEVNIRLNLQRQKLAQLFGREL